MAVLKFRVYFEEDDSIYRDIVIKHTQSFFAFYECILKSFEFDAKHQATFFRSNDQWERGREISVEKYDKSYKVAPLIMEDTTIGSEIKDTNQRFIFVYDFTRNWTFLLELINVSKEETNKAGYPATTRKEGIGPQQYGTKGLLGPKFAEIEEKYDLTEAIEGFGEEGETANEESSEESGDEHQGMGLE